MSPFCERCGCEDPRYFVLYNGQDQCRRCIGYQGQEGTPISVEDDVVEVLPFHLTPAQKRLSNDIYQKSLKQDVLVYAVCGAGKSELILETLSQRLAQGERVGIAVARRQVVLQLTERYRAIYPNLKVRAVCEGHLSDLSGHLVICTTHQLFRFHKAFDCLVLDEPDAFPFANDEVLRGFARQAVLKTTIYLTATPDLDLLQRVKEGKMAKVEHFQRPHGLPLPVPQVAIGPAWLQVLRLRTWLASHDKPTLIFVPHKSMGHKLSRWSGLPFVYANHPDIDTFITQFKEGKIRHLITTTVLERGVTFSDVQVAILMADHEVYSLSSLIQIAGRVGRSPQSPTGEVHFHCSKKVPNIQTCLRMIQEANASFASNPPP